MTRVGSISIFAGFLGLWLSPAARAEPAAAIALPAPCASADDTLTGNWGGRRDTIASQYGITFCVQEQSEVFGNLRGGLRRGATYDGLTTASLKVDNIGGLNGTSVYVSLLQIHGRGPTANLVGNLQTITNTEATRSTKLYGLWIEQSLLGGDLTVRIGQESAADELMVVKSAGTFINSSFGFPALMALNLPSGAPSYPLAAMMVRLQYKLNDRFTVTGAAFDGDPAGPGFGDPQLRDRTGTAFRLRDGVLTFLELTYTAGSDGADGRPGTYKLGGWYHSGQFNDPVRDTTGQSLASPGSNGIPRQLRGNRGIYVSIDQTVWRPAGDKDRGINVFALAMAAPDDRNFSSFFMEGGVAWTGPFEGREKDVAGLAFAYTNLSSAQRALGGDLVRYGAATSAFRGHETVVELTYQYWVMPGLTLQPDLQYVINPGAGLPNATNTPLKNALVAGMRATLVF